MIERSELKRDMALIWQPCGLAVTLVSVTDPDNVLVRTEKGGEYTVARQNLMLPPPVEEPHDGEPDL